MVQDLNNVIQQIVKEELQKKMGSSIFGSSLFYDNTTNYDEVNNQIGGLMLADGVKKQKKAGLMLADGMKSKKHAKGGDFMGDFWTGFKKPFEVAWDNKDTILAAAKLVGLGKKKPKQAAKKRNGGLDAYKVVLEEVRAQYPNKSFRECQQIAKREYHK